MAEIIACFINNSYNLMTKDKINYNKIQNFITEQFNKNEPLDAIWYCITGTKVEDVEIELVKQ